MPRDGLDQPKWRDAGVVACPGCQTRYAVREAAAGVRGDHFFRCDACGEVVDEWCCATLKSFDRVA